MSQLNPYRFISQEQVHPVAPLELYEIADRIEPGAFFWSESTQMAVRKQVRNRPLNALARSAWKAHTGTEWEQNSPTA